MSPPRELGFGRDRLIAWSHSSAAAVRARPCHPSRTLRQVAPPAGASAWPTSWSSIGIVSSWRRPTVTPSVAWRRCVAAARAATRLRAPRARLTDGEPRRHPAAGAAPSSLDGHPDVAFPVVHGHGTVLRQRRQVVHLARRRHRRRRSSSFASPPASPAPSPRRAGARGGDFRRIQPRFCPPGYRRAGHRRARGAPRGPPAAWRRLTPREVCPKAGSLLRALWLPRPRAWSRAPSPASTHSRMRVADDGASSTSSFAAERAGGAARAEAL